MLFSLFETVTSFLPVYTFSTCVRVCELMVLWKRSSNLCLSTSEIVVPPLLNFWSGVITLSMSPALPISM